MKRFFTYLKDSTHELKLVTWPKQDELLRLTIITIIFVIISAIILGTIDFGFAQGYKWILSLGG